jgi:uncharacterized cupredoxin-like copper-binding protein
MKRFVVLLLMISLVALLAACGGDEGNGEGENGGSSLTFEGTDALAFNPATATASTGGQVEVTLNNTGVLEHSWGLLEEGADATTATEDDLIDGTYTGTVAAGASGTASFTAPAAGTYTYVCVVPGHAAGGMVGTLTIE